MEFMVPVNKLLSEKITKLNYTLIPPGFHGDVRSVRVMQESLSRYIDHLGELSAKAQGLNKVITTAEKLRNSQDHILYLLKDGNAKGGNGELIGLLKVGWKHLFLFDEKQKVREVEPLCILDFFVLTDRQRLSYGKILFDYMLNDLQAEPKALAIDGPSPKIESFLRKHYGIQRLVRQNNNFAISEDFFSTVSDNKSGRTTPVVTSAVGRFAAPKPQSAIANVIHGTYSNNSNGTSVAATPKVEAAAGPVDHVTEHPDANTGNNEPSLIESENNTKPDKEEFADLQKSPERPSTLKVEPVTKTASSRALSPAGSTSSRRKSQLTHRGYFDVKFYHHKLWTSVAATPEVEAAAGPVDHVTEHPDAKTGNNEPSLIESENDTKPDKEELADLQKSPERPSTLKVEPVTKTAGSPALSPAGSTSSRRDSQLTDRGYFDVKFYHNKLW